jgi:hypothetical protein
MLIPSKQFPSTTCKPRAGLAVVAAVLSAGAFAAAQDAPKPAAPAEGKSPVIVTLKNGSDYYGPGVYYGWIASKPEDTQIVLILPGGGKLTLPKDQASVEELRQEPEPPKAEAEGAVKAVPTTHVVHLKNGRKLVGTVVATAESEPLKLRLGNLGVQLLDRKRVEKVEEAAGSYELPAAELEIEPGREAVQPRVPVPPEAIEELKKEIRRQILRELLEGIIDEKVESKIDKAVEKEKTFVDAASFALPEDVILDIQFQVRELGRQRNTNRVRAEAALTRHGAAVLPFLSPAASHPFELTRRAVQRIIADIGDVRASPLAIRALNDEDVFVRRLAHDALVKLLGTAVSYDPQGDERARRAAQEKYEELWESVQREHLHHALSGKAAELLGANG